MKCELCKQKIPETFMKKILGTVIKDDSGKKHYVCKECQSKHNNDKKAMLEQL